MTARSFLVRGLLAGFIAGLFAFGVAYTAGEPHVEKAISLEEAGAAPDVHSHGGESLALHGDEEGTTVSRHNQRVWGLLTGNLVVGTALGGLVALVSAAAVGRLGSLRPGSTTAIIAAVGFVAVALVPFLKYPATPPAVGNADTIGSRTGLYFLYLLISVVVAVGAVLAARALAPRIGTFEAIAGAAVAYVVIVIVAGQILPTVNEIGDFPADTLWYFRRASIMTLATLWAVLGLVLTYLVRRLDRDALAVLARRELAASL